MNSSLETVKFIEQSKKSALENEMILPILPMKMEWNTEESCSKAEKHERNKSRKKKLKGWDLNKKERRCLKRRSEIELKRNASKIFFEQERDN